MKRVIPKKKPKKKQTKLPTLIAKADAITSQYIRQKYADESGNVKCVSCDAVLHWSKAHCCHWIGRSAKSVRWDERNLMPGCAACNCYRPETHSREYTLFQLDRYGREGIEEIKADSRKILRGSEVRQLATEAIEYYTNALKEL
jgi:hypothetical protein